MNQISAQPGNRIIPRLWKIGVFVAGTLLVTGISFYKLNIVSFFIPFFLNLKLQFHSIIAGILKVTGGSTIDISLFVLAGVILLLIFGIDSMITRHREKLSSFLRMLPILG
jgi:hypothetical protein